MVKNFRHLNAGLVTSVNVHKHSKSTLLVITTHTENSVRLWDYETETILVNLRGDYCSPIFSSYFSYSGFGKGKYFDICSSNDNFENVLVWNTNNHTSLPVSQIDVRTDVITRDVLTKKYTSNFSSLPVLPSETITKFFSLTSLFEWNYVIPLKIENQKISYLGRRSSEIGIFEPFVTLEPLHKREQPPFPELKDTIMNSPSSYVVDEIAL